MPKPPTSPPSSDIEGVTRDWRPGLPSRDPEGQPAAEVQDARADDAARPPQSGAQAGEEYSDKAGNRGEDAVRKGA
jgi:hypothetical protein